MNDCLIGYTGFVGGILDQQFEFEHKFNSKNIKDIAGRSFNRVFCAGLQAKKWLANKDPEQDIAGIESLKTQLNKVSCKQFILISTVDVYADVTSGQSESQLEMADSLHPYGRHRLEFEHWVKKHFQNAVIIRLPALFGRGLRKNVLFDLLNENQIENVSLNGVFQWYDMEWLKADIEKVLSHNIAEINLVTEPVSMTEIVDSFFSEKKLKCNVNDAPKYNLKTEFDWLYSSNSGYTRAKQQVLDGMATFTEDYEHQS